MDTPPAELLHKSRSGTANRRKQNIIPFRVTDAERAQLENRASSAGLSTSSYIRKSVLDIRQTGQRRRPLADVAALARLMGELNRIGSNINQVARAINLGETPLADDIREALAGHREIIAAIRAAMGLGGK